MMLYVLSDYAKADPTAQALLKEAGQDEGEYAAFVRALVGCWQP